MIKNYLFEINELEKSRILESHRKATKRHYLKEQMCKSDFGGAVPCSKGEFLGDSPSDKSSLKKQNRTLKQSNQEWYKDFKLKNPEIKDLDFDTFVKMNDEVTKVNNWNKNTWYDKAFDQNNNLNDFGKQYSSDIPNWYRYYRKVFGKKELNVSDIYNHWKVKGGLNKYKDANQSGYDLSLVNN